MGQQFLVALHIVAGVTVKGFVAFCRLFDFAAGGAFDPAVDLFGCHKGVCFMLAVTAVKIGGVAGKGGEHQYQHQSGCQMLFLNLGARAQSTMIRKASSTDTPILRASVVISGMASSE